MMALKLTTIASQSVVCDFVPLRRMLDLVEQLKGFLLDGQVVYMHCWGGRGRAGTIASCFLASCYHLGAEETANRIQLAFDTRNDGGMQ